jgi:hypothetical protein
MAKFIPEFRFLSQLFVISSYVFEVWRSGARILSNLNIIFPVSLYEFLNIGIYFFNRLCNIKCLCLWKPCFSLFLRKKRKLFCSFPTFILYKHVGLHIFGKKKTSEKATKRNTSFFRRSETRYFGSTLF